MLINQAENMTGEPAQKRLDKARELLELANLNENDVNFYLVIKESRPK